MHDIYVLSISVGTNKETHRGYAILFINMYFIVNDLNGTTKT